MMSPVSVIAILLISTAVIFITESTVGHPGTHYPQCDGRVCIRYSENGGSDCPSPCNCNVTKLEGHYPKNGKCTNPLPRQ
uniref:Secreted peptide n=1 Tax=Rhipicephalus pulchellus TaxID=72859 RepID=L7LU63_RHIPC